MAYHLEALPSLSDNYIWLLINATTASAIIIDPGSSLPCESYFKQHDIQPVAILVTHRHWDHVDGIESLVRQFNIPVYGPANEYIPCLNFALKPDERVEIDGFDKHFQVIDLSGHTAGHVGYAIGNSFFCGDTLFSAGCGRLFDGTAEQLHTSIQRIKALPKETVIYCAHEYTLDNLHFAQAVEPDNPAIQKRLEDVIKLRSKNRPSLPFSLEQELQYNPFLRTEKEAVMQAVADHSGKNIKNSEDCFKYLRIWKDGF